MWKLGPALRAAVNEVEDEPCAAETRKTEPIGEDRRRKENYGASLGSARENSRPEPCMYMMYRKTQSIRRWDIPLPRVRAK